MRGLGPLIGAESGGGEGGRIRSLGQTGTFGSYALPLDMESVRHKMDHMKTATVRELRNDFPRIEAWVNEGESVNISKRGKVIATLVPASANSGESSVVPKPDIMARLRETWGERVFSLEEVSAMREDELKGDLG